MVFRVGNSSSEIVCTNYPSPNASRTSVTLVGTGRCSTFATLWGFDQTQNVPGNRPLSERADIFFSFNFSLAVLILSRTYCTLCRCSWSEHTLLVFSRIGSYSGNPNLLKSAPNTPQSNNGAIDSKYPTRLNKLVYWNHAC